MVVTARNSSRPAYMQAESSISAGTLRSPRPMKAGGAIKARHSAIAVWFSRRSSRVTIIVVTTH